ncbi:MAG: WhiB family transcriptional regulator [Ilumatobacter sp.]|nr:WhiB family transcriptional regulator [Ilumatobacter sp.]
MHTTIRLTSDTDAPNTFKPASTQEFKDTRMHTSVNTTEIASRDLSAPQVEIIGRESLAPDSPRPPGSGELFDDSLAARIPVARCADGSGTTTGLFFSDNVAAIARAKAMWALCPIRPECLQAALE